MRNNKKGVIMKKLLLILSLAGISALQAHDAELMQLMSKLEGKTVHISPELFEKMLELKAHGLRMKARHVASMARRFEKPLFRVAYLNLANSLFNLADQVDALPIPKNGIDKTFKDVNKWMKYKTLKLKLKARFLREVASQVMSPEMAEKAGQIEARLKEVRERMQPVRERIKEAIMEQANPQIQEAMAPVAPAMPAAA